MKILPVLTAICILATAFPVKAQTPAILSVPCFNGGGSGGWMYENLPAEYFPLGLVSANQWPLRSVSDHPMYNPDAPWNKYATCVVVPASQPSLETSIVQSVPEVLSVPCVDGGGSGGWMYEDLPAEYFPLGLISANQWPLRSVSDHPMYNPDAPWNKYATCVVVPANQS